MGNQSWMAIALIVIGVVGVNFFYLSDVLMGADTIQLGLKSFIAIGGANVIALAGATMAIRTK
jgi:lipopolysaccharide export LptBFGC system permease protein LptF